MSSFSAKSIVMLKDVARSNSRFRQFTEDDQIDLILGKITISRFTDSKNNFFTFSIFSSIFNIDFKHGELFLRED